MPLSLKSCVNNKNDIRANPNGILILKSMPDSEFFFDE